MLCVNCISWNRFLCCCCIDVTSTSTVYIPNPKWKGDFIGCNEGKPIVDLKLNIQCCWCDKQFSGENRSEDYENHKEKCYREHEELREKFTVKIWDGVI